MWATIVDGANDPAQWTVANSSLRLMDGLVPYVLVPGNHDSDSNRVGLIDNYFAPRPCSGSPTPMTTGQIENNYALVDIGHSSGWSWVSNSGRAMPFSPGPMGCSGLSDQARDHRDPCVSVRRRNPLRRREVGAGFKPTEFPGFHPAVVLLHAPKRAATTGKRFGRSSLCPTRMCAWCLWPRQRGGATDQPAARRLTRAPDAVPTTSGSMRYRRRFGAAADFCGPWIRLQQEEIRVQTYSPYPTSS